MASATASRVESDRSGRWVGMVFSPQECGCACGCRGTYWDADNPKHARQITRITNTISRSIMLGITTITDDEFIAVEGAGRVYVAYF